MQVAGIFSLAPADSARAVGEVYGLSLLATIPIAVAALALVALQGRALRGSGAGARALACRAAVVALLALYVGRFLPIEWMAWVAPEGLAGPLVVLGRAQLAATGALLGDQESASAATAIAATGSWRNALVHGVLWVYWLGVGAVLVPTVWWRWRLRRAFGAGRGCSSAAWRRRVDAAADAAGIPPAMARRIRLRITPRVRIPMTWGGEWRPVIVLPVAAAKWSAGQLHAALVHELSHLRHGDVPIALAARLACALFWFHPGVWWLATRLSEESELACDDRVLLSGVRPSDYAELLSRALPARGGHAMAGVVALGGGSGVRARLSAIVDTSRRLRSPSRRTLWCASLLSAVLALPLGAVRIAPTRDVLTSLMRDGRWESRAYAVVHLAQRSDSVEVARDAAAHDPDPQVRAWAQAALARAHDPSASSPHATPDRPGGHERNGSATEALPSRSR